MTNLSLEYLENGIKVYQDNDLYKFTSDAIKLAKFCKVKKTDNVLDMCAGCGVVGFYVYALNGCNKLYFNEIQTQMCKLIDKSIQLNSLQDKCKVINADLNVLNPGDFDKPFDAIVCNPPYFKLNGKIKENEDLAICRHEIKTNLQQIVAKASKLIKEQGKFYLIIPANRMCETIILFAQNAFEVKNLQVYHSKQYATVCLLEGVKNGKSGVKVNVVSE